MARSPPHGPRASNWAWISRWVRVSRKTPISLASMSRARWSLTALLSQGLLEGADAALPVDVGAGLLGLRRDGQHDVGDGRDGRLAQLEGDDEGAFSSAAAAAASPRSDGSTPPTTRASMSPAAAAATMPAVSRAGVGRAPGRPPRPRATSARAAASATGRPPGSSAPSAPASRAPRSPARRGTHASRAPVAAARSAAARRAPGDVARRSPTRTTPPAARPRARAGSVEPRSARTAASWPGTVGSRVPPTLARPRVAWDATAYTCVLCLRNALRRRRKTIGLSSSGSKPTRRTALAASRSAYVTAPLSGPVAATCSARKATSSAECGRARKSTSFVPSTTRANLP